MNTIRVLFAGAAAGLCALGFGFQRGTDETDRQPTAEPAKAAAPKDASKAGSNEVTIELKDGYRIITSNGIPDHETGAFPNRGNPNTIRAQSYRFRAPEKPAAREKPTPVDHGVFGVALNGIVFDPGTAEFWKNDRSNGWCMEAIRPEGVWGRDLGLDQNHAHVQPNGAYHYHATPVGLVEKLEAAKGVKHGEAMVLVGWAADGYPIYDHHAYVKADDAASGLREMRSSYQLKKEARPGADASPPGPGGKSDGTYTHNWEYVAGAGDLDECNGRTGVTPEFPGGTYYYVVTGSFPYIPRLWHGAPDASFKRRPPPPGMEGPGGGGRGPGGPGRGGPR